MAVRASMAALITQVRSMIFDPAGASQTFDDQTIQDVLDGGRDDVSNFALRPYETYSSPGLLYLDYYSEFGGVQLGGWEDNAVLKQGLTVTVTPSVKEPIVGHWAFAASTFPPVYITGALHDVYRASADLLERWSARWALAYSFSSDGQSFQRHQASIGLLNLAKMYRQKQRPGTISMSRSDLGGQEGAVAAAVGPNELDRMAQG